MNLNSLVKNYNVLTPDERFALILAAGARGDDAERQRLTSTGMAITLSIRDHAPYVLAFRGIGMLLFLDLLAAGADYEETYDLALLPDTGSADTTEEGGRTAAERLFTYAHYQGFLLKLKIDGWKLFCQRRRIPPYALWQSLPGYDRLQRALELTEEVAWTAEDYLRWFNGLQPGGGPEATQVGVTAETVADELEEWFRERVRWWSGEGGAPRTLP
jgi:hypothetical protein